MVGCEGKPQEQGRTLMSPTCQRPKYKAMEARSEISITRNSDAGRQCCLPGPCLSAGLLPARRHSDLSSTLQGYGGWPCSPKLEMTQRGQAAHSSSHITRKATLDRELETTWNRVCGICFLHALRSSITSAAGLL